MTATLELNCARRKLSGALGETGSLFYFQHLKSWFRKETSKEEFDSEARKLLSIESIHLHNEFLLAILNKCQTLAHFTPKHSISTNNSISGPGSELLSPGKYENGINTRRRRTKRRKRIATKKRENQKQIGISFVGRIPERLFGKCGSGRGRVGTSLRRGKVVGIRASSKRRRKTSRHFLDPRKDVGGRVGGRIGGRRRSGR